MSKMKKFHWLLILFLMSCINSVLTMPIQQNQNGMQQMLSSYPGCIVPEFEVDLCTEGYMKCDSRSGGCCPCPEGTYMPAHTFNRCNHCLNYTNCAAGQKIKTPGNFIHDRICEDYTPTEGTTGSSTPSPVPTVEILSSTKDTSEVTTVVRTPAVRLHPCTASEIPVILLVTIVVLFIWKPRIPQILHDVLHDVVRDLIPARFRGQSSSGNATDGHLSGNEEEKQEMVEERGSKSTHGEAEVEVEQCPDDTGS